MPQDGQLQEGFKGREGNHDKDMSILEQINASTPSWRGWNLHLNDFGFLLDIPQKSVRIGERLMHAKTTDWPGMKYPLYSSSLSKQCGIPIRFKLFKSQ